MHYFADAVVSVCIVVGKAEALTNLERMRSEHKTIALLYHATGTGKTVTAVSDAKRIGKRTLFLAHTKELVYQAYECFKDLWPEVSIGRYVSMHRKLLRCSVHMVLMRTV